MTGNIKVVGGNDTARVAFKNCHPFIRAPIHLNDEHVETAEHTDLTMNLYNLTEYSDNYANTTGSLHHFKRPEQLKAGNSLNNMSATEGDDFSSSFKYQSNFIKKQVATPTNVRQNIDPDVANVHRTWKNIKIAVPLKYVSNFFRTLELPLINTKLYTELKSTKHSIISDTATTFQITKTELYVPVVTLNTENNNKLTELLSEGFKRSVIWNEYKSKIQTITTRAADGRNTDINDIKIILLFFSCK